MLVTGQSEKYAYLSDDDAPDVIAVPRIDEDDLYRLLAERFDGGRSIAGITSSSEYFVSMAAVLAARFGLPGADAGRLVMVRDKWWQRKMLAAAGFAIPAFRVVSSLSAAVAAACDIGFPVVVKPVDGSGSMGVRRCDDSRAVIRHATALLQGANEARKILVESFISGQEYSVEMFNGQAIGVTRKHVGTPPAFVEIGHDYPVGAEDVPLKLVDTIVQATRCLGLEWGPLHWEAKVHRGLAYPIEVNPRLAGGFIPELVRHAQGIDLIRASLGLAIGQLVSLEPCGHRYASIRFLIPSAAGVFEAVERLNEARAFSGVVDVTLYRSVGETLSLEGDFRDRMGHVIAVGDSLAAAASVADRARDTLRLMVKLSSGGSVCDSEASHAVSQQ